MRQYLFSLIFMAFVLVRFSASTAEAAPHWYKCIARAASHTGYYTFKIDTAPCKVYWLEIDKHLKIKICNLPEIHALKPSAMDEYSIVWFNMKTGLFYDYLSGVLDRGRCKKIASPLVRTK